MCCQCTHFNRRVTAIATCNRRQKGTFHWGASLIGILSRRPHLLIWIMDLRFGSGYTYFVRLMTIIAGNANSAIVPSVVVHNVPSQNREALAPPWLKTTPVTSLSRMMKLFWPRTDSRTPSTHGIQLPHLISLHVYFAPDEANDNLIYKLLSSYLRDGPTPSTLIDTLLTWTHRIFTFIRIFQECFDRPVGIHTLLDSHTIPNILEPDPRNQDLPLDITLFVFDSAIGMGREGSFGSNTRISSTTTDGTTTDSDFLAVPRNFHRTLQLVRLDETIDWHYSTSEAPLSKEDAQSPYNSIKHFLENSPTPSSRVDSSP